MLQNKQMTFLLAFALAAVMTGCKHEELEPAGAQVLKAQIEGGATRTSYDSVEGKFSWTAGDEIAIHYSNGSYQTLAVNPEDGSVQAQASTTSRQRDYYAIYPASVADASNYGNATLKVTLPSSYDLSDIVSGAAGNPGWDYSPVPLVAVNDETTSLLDFYHAGGLLRIRCSGLDQNTQKLAVTFDKDVTGSYTVTYVTDELAREVPTITTGGRSSNNEVTFQLAAAGSSIGAEPDPANPRVFVLNVPVPCGTYNSVTVSSYKSDGSFQSSRTFDTKPLVFSRHRGKKLEIGELSFTFMMGSLSNATITYPGGTRNIATDFVSYKTDGVTTEPVPFTLEYSEDGGETWSTTPPTWIVPDSSIDYDGILPSAPQNLGVAIKPQVNSEPDPHHDELASRTAKVDFDLSTINVATGETVATSTANCYVVQAPGTYRFPLVYGNGLKGGAVNESGYKRQSYMTTNTTLLEWFKDHLDNDIRQPYIVTQQVGKVFRAGILWTDGPGLVTDAEYHDNGTPDDGTDDYISFTVPPEYITQGNALIAIFEGGKIAWSWHIWVTDETMVKRRLKSNIEVAPLNLGTRVRMTRTYVGRQCEVRAVQSISGTVSQSISLSQNGATLIDQYSNTYYQFGRKDPYKSPYVANYFYPSGGKYTHQPDWTSASSLTLGMGIQNPTAIFQDWRGVSFLFNIWNSKDESRNDEPTSGYAKTIYDPSPVGYRVADNYAFSGVSYHQEPGDDILPRRWWFDVDSDGAYDESVDILFPATACWSAYDVRRKDDEEQGLYSYSGGAHPNGSRFLGIFGTGSGASWGRSAALAVRPTYDTP